MRTLNKYLLFLLLFLLFESLCSFVGSHQLSQVGHVLISLLQQVGQTLIFLLVNEFTVSLFIFSLREESQNSYSNLTTDLFLDVGLSLTISLRILSFSMRSFSFFCSRSVLAWYVATALVAFWIFAVMERWYSLKSLACCRMLLRYSY